MRNAVVYPILVGLAAAILLVSGIVDTDPVRCLIASALFFTASWMLARHRWARR
jgi:hypothetical protein